MHNFEDDLKNLTVQEDNSDAAWALWDDYATFSGPPGTEVRVKEYPRDDFNDIYNGVKIRNDA